MNQEPLSLSKELVNAIYEDDCDVAGVGRDAALNIIDARVRPLVDGLLEQKRIVELFFDPRCNFDASAKKGFRVMLDKIDAALKAAAET